MLNDFRMFHARQTFCTSSSEMRGPFVVDYSLDMCVLTTIDEKTMKRKSVHLDNIRL